jgi:hypothetical protein
MARQTSLPRFRLDTDPTTEQNNPDIRAASASPNIFQSNPNPQRSQTRIRRSACSDLQNTAIPEERIYHGNRRRSLFVGRPPSPPSIGLSKISSDKSESSEGDYIKLCRQRCQSLYKSLANKTSAKTSREVSPKLNDKNHEDEKEEDEEEINFQPPSRTNYRYSLPDASPAALALRNILKRNKTTKHNHVRIGLPSHSSHSLTSSISTNSSSSSSPISTFRNFLSLVKLPSTKSSNSPSIQHSSLTTLTNATGGSSTTLDQTISSISPAMQWHFEVCKYTNTHIKYTRLLITEPTVLSPMSFFIRHVSTVGYSRRIIAKLKNNIIKNIVSLVDQFLRTFSDIDRQQ